MASRREFIKSGALATAAATAAGVMGASNKASAQAATPGAVQSFSGDKSYAATATPRPWTKPQRQTGPISIDVHTHWSPESYLKAKADLGKPDSLDAANYDMARRKQLMNAMGIQMSLLTLGGFRPWQWVTAEQGAMIARGANDAAIEAHKAFPDSFIAGIELNCSDAAGSLVELNRVAGKPGMVCVHLPTSLGGKDFLYDAAFQPVLARAHDLGLPILLHPLDGQPNWFGGTRLADAGSGVAPGTDFNSAQARFPGLTNSLGNNMEIALTISKLIASGTLDTYPNLTFIATSGGGALPWLAGRLENRGAGRPKQPIATYLRRFYYDSLVYWAPNLRFMAEMVGADRLVLGTDNMYGGGNGGQMTAQPHSVIDAANFNDADRDLILRGNLKRLFKV
jgi:aminocarboxymuconate-semialdehyde decarboxylase